MRAVVQRASKAEVRVDGTCLGSIGQGLVVLLAVGVDDDHNDIEFMIRKVLNLRIFEDTNGKMNLSIQDIGGELLVVSQFTLLGDCRRGNRPSFVNAAPPEKAQHLYNSFLDSARASGTTVVSGQFQAMMDVDLVNQGPVTILLDSKKEF